MRIYVSDFDREALERLFRECDYFRGLVEDVARDDARSLIGGEYMYGFAGDWAIDDTRGDFVELSDDLNAVYRWYKRVQDNCEEFAPEECEIIEAYIAADIGDDINKLKSDAEDVILEHMRGIIRGNIDGADDFIEETALDHLEAESLYIEGNDFTTLKMDIPAMVAVYR